MASTHKPCQGGWILLAGILLGTGIASAQASRIDAQEKPRVNRTFRAFLPVPGDAIDAPGCQVVQILLDRQDKEEFESYMVQVLFRGKPPERGFRYLKDRVEIDFFDTEKPSMRLARVRGGAVEASALDELFYRDNPPKTDSGTPGPVHIKKMVRLTLYMREKADLKFRDTLDRTLIHFRLPKATQPKE